MENFQERRVGRRRICEKWEARAEMKRDFSKLRFSWKGKIRSGKLLLFLEIDGSFGKIFGLDDEDGMNDRQAPVNHKAHQFIVENTFHPLNI